MATTQLDFRQSVAVVIGINAYGGGIPPLRSAVRDAERLAQLLREDHGYSVRLLCDDDASLGALTELFGTTLPAELSPDDRLLVYFAGHGVALDGEDGPAGFLVPHGARAESRESFLPMQLFHQQLSALACRHLLLILDCCFAGAFRWSATRSLWTGPQPIYQERFQRFVRDSAWQVLTSAAYDQEALDVSRFGDRGDDGQHSPFARALFEALGGAADLLVRPKGCPPEGDGLITATELYCYLRDCVEGTEQVQTPGIWQLSKHDKGEFIFFPPGKGLNLAPAPELTLENNPYRGLEPFDEQHRELFFGRATLVSTLAMIATFQPLTVVTGSSGSGKSSLIKAGLLPRLRADQTWRWQILPPLRPGTAPLELLGALDLPAGGSLAERVGLWSAEHPGEKLLLLLDQFEELVTLCRDDVQREEFLRQLAQALDAHGQQLRLLITVRSDFEPQFAGTVLRDHWAKSRFVIPPMTQDDLREAIRGPAGVRVLYFEPEGLVDRIINEVVQMPGALPLLSFTLSELYFKYLERRGNNRALIEADYEQLGGVAGALRNRANEEFDKLDEAHQATMRRVMLRMVSLEGGGAARRRVLRAELDYLDAAENERVETVIRRLSEARLVVEGKEEHGEPYVEPAHDALVRGWDRLWSWIRAEYETLPIQRRLSEAARDWEAAKRRSGLLWDGDPRLEQLEQVRRRPDGWLNRLEHDFIQRSGKYRRRIRRFRMAALAAFIFTLVTLSGVAWQQRGEAVSAAEGWEQEAYVRATAEANALQQQSEAQSARGTAVAEQSRAELERDRAERQTLLAVSREMAAEANVQYDHNYSLGLLLGVASGQITETIESLEVVRSGLRSSPPLAAFRHGADDPRALAISDADGQVVALNNGGALLKWDSGTDQLLTNVPADNYLAIEQAVISKDGRIGAVAAGGQLLFLDLTSSAPRVSRQMESLVPFMHLALSDDGALLAGATVGGEVLLWDVQSGAQLATRSLQEDAEEGDALTNAVGLVFDPQRRTLAVLLEGGLFELWDVTSLDLADSPAPTLLTRPEGDPRELEQVSQIAWSADGALIALGKEDGSILLFEPNGRPAAPTLRGHSRRVSAIAFSPDGTMLASGDVGGSVAFWVLAGARTAPDGQNAPGVRMRGQLNRGHNPTWRVETILWRSDGQMAVSLGGFDIIVWDMGQREPATGPLPGHSSAVASLDWSSDALVSLGDDQQLLLWDGASFQRAGRSIDAGGAGAYRLAWSPDGSLLAGAGADGSILLWAAGLAGAPEVLPAKYDASLTALAWSPDGAMLASGDEEGHVFLWDVAARTLLREHSRQHVGAVWALAFDGAGAMLASGADDGWAFTWDVASGEQLFELFPPGQLAPVVGLSFNEDDSTLTSATTRGLLFVWNMINGSFRGGPISYHSGSILGMASSPDRERFATFGDDDLIVVWFAGTTQPLRQIFAPGTTSVAFSPDGERLVAGYEDGTLALWETPMEAWEERACRVANRGLTQSEWDLLFPDYALQQVCQ